MPSHRIHSRRVLADKIHEFWVEAPLVAAKHRAGQFVIIRLHEQGERVPLTVVGTDPARGLIRLVVQEAGKSTMQMALLKAGDFLQDVAGPLGRATHLENWGSLVAIAGGVGAAPLLPIAKAAKDAGNDVYCVLGARSATLLILEEEFRAVCTELRICTDDGTAGEKGFVSETLGRWMESGRRFGHAVIVGPVAMMEATAKVTTQFRIPAQASLNPIMVDGTGMCGGCRVTVNGKTQFACVDGPEFDAAGVDFHELALRNRAYRKAELQAIEEMKAHECRLQPKMASRG